MRASSWCRRRRRTGSRARGRRPTRRGSIAACAASTSAVSPPDHDASSAASTEPRSAVSPRLTSTRWLKVTSARAVVTRESCHHRAARRLQLGQRLAHHAPAHVQREDDVERDRVERREVHLLADAVVEHLEVGRRQPAHRLPAIGRPARPRAPPRRATRRSAPAGRRAPRGGSDGGHSQRGSEAGRRPRVAEPAQSSRLPGGQRVELPHQPVGVPALHQVVAPERVDALPGSAAAGTGGRGRPRTRRDRRCSRARSPSASSGDCAVGKRLPRLRRSAPAPRRGARRPPARRPAASAPGSGGRRAATPPGPAAAGRSPRRAGPCAGRQPREAHAGFGQRRVPLRVPAGTAAPRGRGANAWRARNTTRRDAPGESCRRVSGPSAAWRVGAVSVSIAHAPRKRSCASSGRSAARARGDRRPPRPVAATGASTPVARYQARASGSLRRDRGRGDRAARGRMPSGRWMSASRFCCPSPMTAIERPGRSRRRRRVRRSDRDRHVGVIDGRPAQQPVDAVRPPARRREPHDRRSSAAVNRRPR